MQNRAIRARSVPSRFAGNSRATVPLNDVRWLPHVEDYSVDLAFSCDWLVHAEMDVLADYRSALSRTLKNEGAAASPFGPRRPYRFG
jgi:hypothetical protein